MMDVATSGVMYGMKNPIRQNVRPRTLALRSTVISNETATATGTLPTVKKSVLNTEPQKSPERSICLKLPSPTKSLCQTRFVSNRLRPMTMNAGRKVKTKSTSVEGKVNSQPATLSRITLSLIHISEPTRLGMISYAVFCLKKKKKKQEKEE